MRLSEALDVIRAGVPDSGTVRRIHLICGFTPLHLETFVRARAQLRFPAAKIEIDTGLFGDLEGNVARAAHKSADAALVAIEWADLDARLDLRSAAGWKSETLDDIATQIGERLTRLHSLLRALAAAMPVAVLSPSLPLPPVTHFPPSQSGAFELQLRAAMAGFLERLAADRHLRVVSESELALRSPAAARLDAALLLHAGFPYSIAHADAVADLALACAFPAAPKKGLITDLDDTVWKGILGDAGVSGVSWSLDRRSHGHALYQQMLGSLAQSGVLVGVASKNDPTLVESAFARPDMILKPDQVFPFEAGWGAKSDAVSRILARWNIAADSVVFVDDSPMELAEVAERHPGIECLRFPADKPAAILELLWTLRSLFGKGEIREEDRVRASSLRTAAAIEPAAAGEASEEFLRKVDAKITLDYEMDSGRAFELVNKTNQFNLNGRRFTEAEWRAYFEQPGAFLVTAGYEDRFGPLGKIAVIAGICEGLRCAIDVWVMSCRAFSRRIEFQMLARLFENTRAKALLLRFSPTPRNGPTQECLRRLLGFDPPEGEIELTAEQFRRNCPPLFHTVHQPSRKERQTA